MHVIEPIWFIYSRRARRRRRQFAMAREETLQVTHPSHPCTSGETQLYYFGHKINERTRAAHSYRVQPAHSRVVARQCVCVDGMGVLVLI